MGRHSIGNTNISFKNNLYAGCWRALQTNATINALYYGPANDLSDPRNLSLCRFLNYQIWPYVVGSNNQGGQKGYDGGEDYSINSYWSGATAYAYYVQFINTTNNTISIQNPGATPYGSPGFFPGATATTTVASGSLDTGKIGHPVINNSSTSQYFRITSSPSSGYSFTGWYTAKSGGSLLTNSTSYNAYYNFSNVYNNARWFARNQVSGPDIWSTTGKFGTSSAGTACEQIAGYTFYLPGTSGDIMTQAGPVWSNSAGTIKYPSGYISQGSLYRYWNSVSSNFFPASSCPGSPGGPV